MVIYKCSCSSKDISFLANDKLGCNDCDKVGSLHDFDLVETKGNLTLVLNQENWTNSQGKVIDIESMSKYYLKNALRKLRQFYTPEELATSTLHNKLLDELLNRR